MKVVVVQRYSTSISVCFDSCRILALAKPTSFTDTVMVFSTLINERQWGKWHWGNAFEYDIGVMRIDH